MTTKSEQERPAKGALTEHQANVIGHIVEGCSDKEIARRMGLTLKGTESLVRRVIRARGFVNRVQLAVWAVRSGVVQ